MSVNCSPVRYILKIHFFIECGQKMIQFKIQFKTKSKIFIQKNIPSTESIVFNGIIHSKKIEENYSKFQFNQLIFGVSLFNNRVSHITPFFELSYTLLTTHALGLYEVTKKFQRYRQ